MPKYHNLIVVFISMVLFLFAIAIYISSRTLDMKIYTWLGINTNNLLFDYLQKHAILSFQWVKYNLPDGLWLLSYLLFIEGVWDSDKRMKFLFCVPIVAFAFILEILQYFEYFPGTGDR